MPLVCELRHITSIPVEVDMLRLENLCRLSASEAAHCLVQFGNSQVPLGEFFDVSGHAADDQTVIWRGNCGHVKGIGAGLRSGVIRIEGSAGLHLGADMTGGRILCEGSAGDWAGAEMRGGQLEIRGDAGDGVGGAYRGGQRGMSGGQILIHGRVGHELGRAMRRGLIAVAGDCGDAPGYAMIAGTIVLCGAVGQRLGAGMKRGSLICLSSHAAPRLLPGWKASGEWSPEFLRPLLKSLRAARFPLPDDCDAAVWRRFVGDFLELGKGEILLRQTAT